MMIIYLNDNRYYGRYLLRLLLKNVYSKKSGIKSLELGFKVMVVIFNLNKIYKKLILIKN